MKRRLPSVVLITSALLASSVVVIAEPAGAAVVTATPSSVANTSAAAEVKFAVGAHAALYLAGGGSVTMTGPGDQTTAYTDGSPGIDVVNGNVTATFDLNSDLPAAPGTYAVAISGPLASDTSLVTVTNVQPTLSGAAALPAGESGVPLTVTAASGTFAAGDALSFTHAGTVVSGLTFSNPDLETGTFSGDVSAARGVIPGSYDVTVTDTADGTAVCAGCVTVQPGTGVVTGLTASSITHTSAALTWSPPTSGPMPTGYDAFVSSDPEPTSTDDGITVSHSGTDLTANVSGLIPGTRYYVSVVTTTIAGPGDATPLSFFTGESSTLTISHTNLHLTYGQQLALSGHFSSGSKPLPDQSIVLYRKIGTAPARALKTVRTDNSGNYSYTFVPRRNATYFATSRGTTGGTEAPAVDASQSANVKGTVAQAVTLKGAAVHHFKWLQLTGKVGPSAAGRTVVIDNKTHGRLKRYATVKVGSASTYKLVLKHVKSGRYKLIAKIAGTSVNLAGASKVLPVLKP